MKIITLLVIVIASSMAFAQPGKPQAKVEEELKRIEEVRREAIKQGDMKTLDGIYADDFAGIVGNGQEITKRQLMEVFQRTNPQVVFTTDEIKVRVLGTTAIFTGRLTGKTADGAIVSASRFTHIFARRKGKWQCVAGQTTLIARQS
jgi:ketosteroid isomerase-like protein